MPYSADSLVVESIQRPGQDPSQSCFSCQANEVQMSVTPASPASRLSSTPQLDPASLPEMSRSRRSPKRVKQTPSPNQNLADRTSIPSVGLYPSRTRSSAVPRSSPQARRGLTHTDYAWTSPCQGPEKSLAGWGLSGRRRETSVPLVSARLVELFPSSQKPPENQLMCQQLSQTLSHFSLSQYSPPTPIMQGPQCASHQSTPPNAYVRERTPTSSYHWNTPRRCPVNSRNPRLPILSRDHVYPSTAPLPHLPSFLGSPFSSKTARGRYMYNATSPSEGPMTERIDQQTFDHSALDWMGETERMAEEITQVETVTEPEAVNEDSPMRPNPLSSGIRHEPSGSTSSLEDFSGSGASSASLPSLGRKSGERHVHPGVVSIWGEEGEDLDAEDFEPMTPSRQPYILCPEVEGAFLMSTKTARKSPAHSPVIAKKAISISPSERLSPLHDFLLDQGATDQTTPSYLPRLSEAKSTCSPASSSTPRFLSSSKTDVSRRLRAKQMKSRSPRSPVDCSIKLDGMMTDTEDNAPDRKRLSGRSSVCNPIANSLERAGRADSSSGSGVGLGILVSQEGTGQKVVRYIERSTSLSRSLSSESSCDIDPSPSKFLSARASARKPFPVLPSTCLDEIQRNPLAASGKATTTIPQTINVLKSHSIRPLLRRGITEPRMANEQVRNTPTNWLSSVYTPSADIKPSPAAFASTGLIKKKSGMTGLEIPKFGQALEVANSSRVSILTKAPARAYAKHNSGNINAVQSTRGLRRKGSTDFASGSNGSIGTAGEFEFATSPATPTKPGLKCKRFPNEPVRADT